MVYLSFVVLKGLEIFLLLQIKKKSDFIVFVLKEGLF